MKTRILSCVFTLGTIVTAAAQTQPRVATADGVRDFRARFGERWSAAVDPLTKRAEMIYGGRAEWAGLPISDEDWVARARVAIEATNDLHGVDVGSLFVSRVTFLPLGQVGSGDKWSIEFHQEFGGIRVEDGDIVALFDARGGLLSIQNHALADVDEIALEPLIAAEMAREQARLSFEKEHAPASDSISTATLVILPVDRTDARVGQLAWRVDVEYTPSNTEPTGRRYWIDARSGYPLRDETNVHAFDISGNVSMFATPGSAADTAGNPEVAVPAKYLRIQHSGGTVFTDVNGNFTILGATAPENVTIGFSGLFGAVDDQPTGIPHTEVFTLNPGPGNNVVLNSGAIDTITSQANIFNHTSSVRDFIRQTIPTDSTADFVAVGHANIASTCNANFNGSAINFFAAGGNCNNTGFSTVVGHEHGHWLNNLYGTNNGSDGMGEGNADVFALYTFDTPLNGEGFFTNGGAVRTGNNTRPFCGDCSPACYSGVHANGEPWMGAAWKLRVNLNNSLGNVMGDHTANLLFLGWMNAYNQRTIRSIIELQWLILDDNDANLLNGTPHATDIKNGFRAQGFPGYEIEFGSTSTIADQTCEASSYAITTAVSTLQNTTISSLSLSWRVNGGAFSTSAMVPTGGANWSGSIPYIVSPANVEYTVTATDSAGNTKDGFCGARSFFIGQVVSFASDDFESDGTWTTGSVGDTTNLNNDWGRGTPGGKTGNSQGVAWTDPAAAASGTACRGNDLGVGSGNGAYQANVHSFLVSAPFDCTGQTGVQLVFKRWLTVEKSQFDTARVLVNDVEVWRNSVTNNTLDSSWTLQSIDIAAIADNNPSVVIRFELQSDGGLELGGWQIDALALGRITRAAQCAPIQVYCAGDGSLATDCPCGNFGAAGHGCADALAPTGGLLSASGTPGSNNVVLTASSLPTFGFGVYLQQDAVSEAVFQNGVMCGSGALLRLRVRATSGGTSALPDGTDTQPLSTIGLVAPGSGSRRYYSLWYRGGVPTFCSPAAANLTNGVMVTW